MKQKENFQNRGISNNRNFLETSERQLDFSVKNVFKIFYHGSRRDQQKILQRIDFADKFGEIKL